MGNKFPWPMGERAGGPLLGPKKEPPEDGSTRITADEPSNRRVTPEGDVRIIGTGS